MSFIVSKEIEENLAILAGSLSERERRKALNALAFSRNGDGSRLLMELFRLSPWSPLRCQILKAVGNFGDLRTTEFLYRQSLSEDDLTTSREAVLSLGQSPVPLAQEILLSLAMTTAFPFRREAIHALGGVPVLTVSSELIEFAAQLQQHAATLDPDHRILHTLVTVLADHGLSSIETDLISLLQREAARPAESGLLHACLLAAGSVATPLVRSALLSLDLDDKTLGASLRSTALRLAEAESCIKLEDALEGLSAFAKGLEVKNGPTRRGSLALSRLARFSSQELKEAIELFDAELEESEKIWLEAIAFDSSGDGSELLARAMLQDDVFLQAACAKSIRRSVGVSRWSKILSELPSADLARVSLVLRDPVILDQLLRLAPREREDKIFTAVCNGLVAQVQMSADRSLDIRVLECLELIAFRSGKRAGLHARALRAIGQIAFEGRVPQDVHEKYVAEIENALVDNRLESIKGTSAIHALGSAPSKASLRVLEKAIDLALENEPSSKGCSLLLNTLITFPQNLLSEWSLVIDAHILSKPELQRTFLRLLGLGVSISTGDGSRPAGLVHEALSSQSFSKILLALDAAANFNDSKTQELIFGLASHDDETVRSLALERICRSKMGELQNRLVGLWRHSFKGTADLLLRCIDAFEINPLDPPLVFAEHLRELCLSDSLGHPQSPFSEPAVRAEGLALADQILAVGRNRESEVASRLEQETLPGVDASLMRDLPGYSYFSDTLKSVLRNAELPFCYPDIFDETVDKSTAVIEFVKSIDLLLQERVGEPLFLGSRPEVLAKLRTRVARLGLHEPAENNDRIIDLLGLSGVFTSDLFPSIKLGRLVQSVLAGRFVTEQTRILDGLKGWAVFLVLFARAFQFGGLQLDAVLPVKPMPGQRVAKIAWELIQLQEKRNTAAHRGTILRASELQELRRTSIAVLAALDEIFPQASARGRPRSVPQNRGVA